MTEPQSTPSLAESTLAEARDGSTRQNPPATLIPPRMPPPLPGDRPTGRRYGFLCSYCSSRLEATENMAGQSGTCPTCGNTIVIPILDYRGRLIDPTTHEIIKQDPHPVHAYAAAGHRAPQIVTDDRGDRHILCPRCNRLNSIAGNNCLQCGLPFTMEGTAGDAIGAANSWAVASLVLGIVSLAGGCALAGIPPVLAIIFGALALRGTNQPAGGSAGRGMAIAGIVLGVVAIIVLAVIMATGIH